MYQLLNSLQAIQWCLQHHARTVLCHFLLPSGWGLLDAPIMEASESFSAVSDFCPIAGQALPRLRKAATVNPALFPSFGDHSNHTQAPCTLTSCTSPRRCGFSLTVANGRHPNSEFLSYGFVQSSSYCSPKTHYSVFLIFFKCVKFFNSIIWARACCSKSIICKK